MKKQDKLKESLGKVNLDWIADTSIKKPRSQNVKKIKRPEVKMSERPDVPGINFIKEGKKNYYLSKTTGEVIQKVTVHLPFEMVFNLKGEGTIKGKTLSELIREKLRFADETQKAKK